MCTDYLRSALKIHLNFCQLREHDRLLWVPSPVFVYFRSEKIFPSASPPFLLHASEKVQHTPSLNPSIMQLKTTIMFHFTFSFQGCPKATLSLSDCLYITHSRASDYLHRSATGPASVCGYLCTAEHSTAHVVMTIWVNIRKNSN